MLVVTGLLAGAGVLGYLNVRFGQITRFDVATDQAAASEPRNYLIVGSDSRAGLDEDDPANNAFFGDDVSASDPQRTDTIMILRVDPAAGAASILSIPRDLWVPISDTGNNNRINSAYPRGRDVLIETIRQNFKIPIHHYIEVNFVGFINLVSAIDGVPMYFDSPVRDTHSGLLIPDAGCVDLDARTALSFARSRYLQVYNPDTEKWTSDPSGDFGRISRQQEFIRRAISRAVAKGVSNPATLNSLVNVAVDAVGLDPDLSASDMVSLARQFANFNADTLKTYSLPTTNMRTSAGASVEQLVEREAEPIFNIFRGVDPNLVTPGSVDVTVLNGTDRDGLAGDVTDAIEAVGFVVEEPGDTEEPQAQTTLYIHAGNERFAAAVMQYLSGPTRVDYDEGLETGEVVLVAGADFTTVHDQPSPTIPEITTTTERADEDSSTTAAMATTSTTEPIGYVPDDTDAAASCR